MFSIEVRNNIKTCGMAIFLGLIDEVIYYASKKSTTYNTQKILVIEPNNKRYKKTIEEIKWNELKKHPGFTIIKYSNNFFRELNEYLLSNQNYGFLRNFDLFYNFDDFEKNNQLYIQILTQIKGCITYTLMFYGNDAKDSLIGYYNMFNNIHEICNNPGINLLKDKFKDLPAIIVGAGPSLTKNMQYLKGIEDKALLIAADAALKPLLDNGIKPHLITTLEREPEIELLFKDIHKDKLEGIYLVACPVVYNEVFKAYKGEKIICYRQFDHFKWIGIERGMLPIKTSPGNMNFNIAEYLGCNTIIMVGQDMALDGDITNVDGAVLGNSQQTYKDEPKYEVKGNAKDKVITTHFLKTVLESFVLDVSNSKSKVINTSDIGAYVEGTELMNLEESKEKYITKTVNINKKIKQTLSKFIKNDIIVSKKPIKLTIKHFKRCIDMCNKSICILKDNNSTFKDKISIITNVKNDMTDNKIAWQLYFAHIVQSIFINHELHLSTLKQNHQDEKTIQDKYIQLNVEYFETIKDLLRICIDDLIKFRNDEYFEI
jgi:hypothetical protein